MKWENKITGITEHCKKEKRKRRKFLIKRNSKKREKRAKVWETERCKKTRKAEKKGKKEMKKKKEGTRNMAMPFFSLQRCWPWRACLRWEGSLWRPPHWPPSHAWDRRRRGPARSSASCRRTPGLAPLLWPNIFRKIIINNTWLAWEIIFNIILIILNALKKGPKNEYEP